MSDRENDEPAVNEQTLDASAAVGAAAEAVRRAEAELRRARQCYDKARQETFLRNVGGLQRDQQTVAAELSYVF